MRLISSAKFPHYVDALFIETALFAAFTSIIPIYLIHRPSNDIPYATLEEELIGDFVKYSVKDGKEINLMRRDSEAGQKCCAFQHWVYHNTEGNLLVTDMQGQGQKIIIISFLWELFFLETQTSISYVSFQEWG